MTSRLGDWDLLEVVGVGAHAVVHRAVHRDRPGRVVAVKRLREVGPDAVAALRREADVLSDLAHPAIAVLHEVVVDGDEVALVLALATGGSLVSRLGEQGRLGARDVVDLGRRLAGGLAAAHDVGVLHRDVTPSNVLYGREDEPRLADFGLAGAIDVPPDEIAGTSTYLDPDVVHGAPPGPASDTWGLAVVLWEALAGQPPWMGADDQAVQRAADRGLHLPLARLVPDAPDGLVAVLERGILRDQRDRFRHPQELELALAGVRSGEAASTVRCRDGDGHQRATEVVDGRHRDPVAPTVARRRPVEANEPDGGAPVGRDGPMPDAVARDTAEGTSDEGVEVGPRPLVDDVGAEGVGFATTVFGPRPTVDPPERDAARWSVPTRVVVVAAVVIPLVVAGVAWWLSVHVDTGTAATASTVSGSSQGRPSPQTTSSSTDAASAPVSTSEPRTTGEATPSRASSPPTGPSPNPSPSLPAGWVPREPPPACPGDDGRPPGADAQVLAADVEGHGCTVPVVVDVGQAPGRSAVILEVAADAPAGGRYAVADAGDAVVVGDWDGDGIDTPAVVTATEGQVYTYRGWSVAGEPDVVSVPTGQAPVSGEAAVATDPEGLDHVVDAATLP